jgi:general secretion pathway protein F
MAIFEYRALNAAGKTVKGIVEADAIKTAKLKLKKHGLILTEIREKNVIRKSGAQSTSGSVNIFNRIKIADISLGTRQLASLVRANIPLVDALSALIDQTENNTLKAIFANIRQDVNEGSSLAKALSKHPKAFNTIFVNMVEAGESSGTLPLVLIRLADFQESQVRLKNKITSALTYPVLMMLVTFGLLVGIFTFVIPKIVGIFESMNKTMPIQTRFLIFISDTLVSYWWLITGVTVLVLISFFRYINTPKGRTRWDTLLLRLPVIGPLIRMLAVSRFSNTLSTLLVGGVPILTAMNIVKNIVGNTLIMNAITQARENVTEGQSIAEPLKRSKQFPPLVIHMIAIGEKTGELPQMLQNVSSTYEEQVTVKIEGLTALLEPAMIIVMGVVVGGIVASIFIPLLDLNNIE